MQNNIMDHILDLCLQETGKNPVEILEKMMSLPFCHMHGPEHHVLVGAALLTAYKNAGGELDLEKALQEMNNRGPLVPGGACGSWGACGAGISTGMYMSIVTKATPLTKESWGLSNRMTSRALNRLGSNDGPRCCKRDSYHAVLAAVEFTEEELGVKMDISDVKCSRSDINDQCIKARCPFNK